MTAVERSDLPEGQQSKGSFGPAFNESAEEINVAIRKLVAGLDTLGIRPYADNASSWSWVLFGLDGIEKLQREVARVRAEVAEEIALDLAEWARRQFAQATVAWNPQSKRDLEAYGRAYDNGAGVARLHAGEGPDSPAGRLDRVWWLHRCDDVFTWLSDPTAADAPRPERCGGCGEAASKNWFTASKVNSPGLPKE